MEVMGVDASIGAVTVCKKRGVKNVAMLPLQEIDSLTGKFETATLFGNDFGLLGDSATAGIILSKIAKITSKTAYILATVCDPYKTTDERHLRYHDWNKKRERMPGQLLIRVVAGDVTGDWFDYLFVSPDELELIIKSTEWKIRRIITHGSTASFGAILEKKNR
jgi:hypothetical protein